ncbi:hypothetical protein B0H13DRAFT_2562451 [Mycena leptocephala]|nr:hypothetical protein B0H13DRAFT_2562451 [Mycena leptocephala]
MLLVAFHLSLPSFPSPLGPALASLFRLFDLLTPLYRFIYVLWLQYAYKTRQHRCTPTPPSQHLYRIPRGLGDHTLRIPVSPLPISIAMSPSRITVLMGSYTTRGVTRSHAPPTLPHLLQTLFPCPSAPSPSATLHLFACVMASPASVSGVASPRPLPRVDGPRQRLFAAKYLIAARSGA